MSEPAPTTQKPARNVRAAAAVKAFHEEERIGKAYDLDLVKKMWPFVKPHQKLLWLSLLVILFTTAAALVRPLIMRSGRPHRTRTCRTNAGPLRASRTALVATASTRSTPERRKMRAYRRSTD